MISSSVGFVCGMAVGAGRGDFDGGGGGGTVMPDGAARGDLPDGGGGLSRGDGWPLG